MPRLRGPHKPKTEDDKVREARRLRQAGYTLLEIAARVNKSQSWVTLQTKDIAPSKLRQRSINLIRRGFDVPPSKQEAFDALTRARYRLAEIKEILKLE